MNFIMPLAILLMNFGLIKDLIKTAIDVVMSKEEESYAEI